MGAPPGEEPSSLPSTSTPRPGLPSLCYSGPRALSAVPASSARSCQTDGQEENITALPAPELRPGREQVIGGERPPWGARRVTGGDGLHKLQSADGCLCLRVTEPNVKRFCEFK